MPKGKESVNFECIICQKEYNTSNIHHVNYLIYDNQDTNLSQKPSKSSI